ncbi:hypothetical protein C0J52_25911 [Blattella germanica]|nr:hypothetical protein C0J52_25911 [Blattella germanica]
MIKRASYNKVSIIKDTGFQHCAVCKSLNMKPPLMALGHVRNLIFRRRRLQTQRQHPLVWEGHSHQNVSLVESLLLRIWRICRGVKPNCLQSRRIFRKYPPSDSLHSTSVLEEK